LGVISTEMGGRWGTPCAVPINRPFGGTHLVDALRYMPDGRRFDSRWCHWPWGRLIL